MQQLRTIIHLASSQSLVKTFQYTIMSAKCFVSLYAVEKRAAVVFLLWLELTVDI